jgi:hypothetical protein
MHMKTKVTHFRTVEQRESNRFSRFTVENRSINHYMVLQVLTNSGQIFDDRDIHFVKMLLGSDTACMKWAAVMEWILAFG